MWAAGACFGAGLDIIAAADIRYCSADAYFCVKEVDIAITADMGVLQRLPGLIGQGMTQHFSLHVITCLPGLPVFIGWSATTSLHLGQLPAWPHSPRCSLANHLQRLPGIISQGVTRPAVSHLDHAATV